MPESDSPLVRVDRGQFRTGSSSERRSPRPFDLKERAEGSTRVYSCRIRPQLCSLVKSERLRERSGRDRVPTGRREGGQRESLAAVRFWPTPPLAERPDSTARLRDQCTVRRNVPAPQLRTRVRLPARSVPRRRLPENNSHSLQSLARCGYSPRLPRNSCSTLNDSSHSVLKPYAPCCIS